MAPGRARARRSARPEGHAGTTSTRPSTRGNHKCHKKGPVVKDTKVRHMPRLGGCTWKWRSWRREPWSTGCNISVVCAIWLVFEHSGTQSICFCGEMLASVYQLQTIKLLTRLLIFASHCCWWWWCALNPFLCIALQFVALAIETRAQQKPNRKERLSDALFNSSVAWCCIASSSSSS